MMEEVARQINLKRNKMKYESIPDKLKSVKLDELVQSVIKLHSAILNGERNGPNKITLPPEQILKLLVRGLGSSDTQTQMNYFAALVTLLTSCASSPSPVFSAKRVLETVASELHVTGNTSKGEEGEVLLGRVLAFGTLVRSGALQAAAEDMQASAVTQLLEDIKAKSYLPLVADAFLIEYLKQIEEAVFRQYVWPSVKAAVCPGLSQSLLVYHVLLVCEERFPAVLTPKYLKQTLGAPRILHDSILSPLLSSLKNELKPKIIDHPVYPDVFRYLAHAPGDILQGFWREVESQLLGDCSVASNRQVTAIRFFSLVVSQVENAAQVLPLLSPKLLSWFLRKHKVPGAIKPFMADACRNAFSALHKLCAKVDSSKTVLAVIKKLLLDPGYIFFDQLSGTRVVHQLTGLLKAKGLMKLASVYREVITGSSTAVEHKDSGREERPWQNKERLHTVHLFCRLLSLPVVQGQAEWRLQQLTFLFDLGFFPPATTNVSVEFASNVRESFFGCLNHRQSSLSQLQDMLTGVAEHINKRLDNGDQLRVKLPPQVMPTWRRMYDTATQITAQSRPQEPWVAAVFQTMFYHIGLHLFKEATFATDVLQELHSVYDRVGSTASAAEEPHWTEVVVEMFLSLLSRNSQLHRNLIGCIFSHFCPNMLPQNIYQILQVLDPTNNSNPLLTSLDADSESSSDEDAGGGDDGAGEDVESSDDGMTDEEEEEEDEGEEDEKVNDKLRRAVIEALGNTGALTDVESVDLDDMDETEAARVDQALSMAFKANKPSRPNKQPAHAKALTHFRLRVLDLVEVWLASDPPLDLLVDTLLKLVTLLEHTLVDRHQAPLETRLRAVIRKLTSTKKFNVSDCNSLRLGNILKSLLDKGERSASVYMSVSKELVACALFVTKASHHLPDDGDADDVTVLSVLKEILKSFFTQRDCLLTVALFEGLFRLGVPCMWSLALKLPAYAFDPSVHPFRRAKAVEFLMVFWQANRLVGQSTGEHQDQLNKMARRLYKGSVKLVEEPGSLAKQKFVFVLRKALQVAHTRGWLTDSSWEQHSRALLQLQRTSKEKKVNGRNDAPTVEEMEVGDESNDDTREERGDEAEEQGENDVEEEDKSANEKDDENGDDRSSSGELNTTNEKGDETNGESEASASGTEAPPKKKSKKSRKKKSHEKTKRAQLLKNNSKKMRLESMAAGLEENLFTKYNVLVNNTTPPSPER